MVVSIGIYRPEQFRRLRTDTFFGRRRKFALDLMADVDRLGSNSIKEAFIESITDGAGVYKRTYSGRFPAFDRQILACMASGHFPRPLRILDVAVSDGSTSVEFFNEIAAQITADFQFIATDRDAGFLILNRKASPDRRVIVSATGEIVQMVWPPFVFSGGKRDNATIFLINTMIWPYALRCAQRLVSQWKEKAPELEVRELVFACKPFRDLLAADSRLAFKAWNIATDWPGDPVHCIRAMNILNPSYFSKDQFNSIIRNLMANLVEGGLLAIGSNEGPESEVDGAIYRLEGGRLAELISSGAGARCRYAIKSLLTHPR
ncbi:MAG: hypothetical protein ACLPJY_12120 [Rhodomicrobium sp.]